ncbi:MAG TPA: PEP-CTERM sorting domain-containing protein [Pirellulales bacterium]|nr:PEP-CTERM sorting domain-containing protein [Pirellulales bacterium]
MRRQHDVRFKAILQGSVVILFLLQLPARGDSPYTLTDLGVVQITGGGAKDINQSGQVALNLAGTGYVWTNGVLTPPGGVFNNNVSFAINDSAHLAWTQNLNAVYWNGTTTIQLPDLEQDGASAQDINDSDQVIGYSYRPSILQYRAVLWNGTTATDLGALTPNGGSYAYGINNAGTIVGQSNNLPVQWIGGAIGQLGLPAGMTIGAAYSVNEAGQSVGYSTPSSPFTLTATLWNGTQPVLLPSLGTRTDTEAFGINNSGVVVGMAEFGFQNSPRAFIYSGGTMQDLTTLVNQPGWVLQQANAINDAGDIVGIGTLNGQTHAFVLRTVPEPSTGLLVAFAMTIWLARRRIRNR